MIVGNNPGQAGSFECEGIITQEIFFTTLSMKNFNPFPEIFVIGENGERRNG
jgi:hypothetical protein